MAKLIRTFGPIAGATAKVYWDAEWEEYIVRLWCGSEEQKKADYHTDEKEDAFSTAKAMLEQVRSRCGDV